MNEAGHGRRLAILVLLAIAIQSAVISRAPLVSLDGLRFLRLARWIDERGLTETLQRSGQHPLYPMATFGVQKCLSSVVELQDSASWQGAGRLTAAGAVVLLVFPLYAIGVTLFSPTTAMLGTALFLLLPETASLGAEALSDSSYLLFFAAAFWAGLRFLENRRNAWLFLCGALSGLAFLARPEGLMLPAAVTIAVVAPAIHWRNPFGGTQTATSAACLCAGVALFALPYMATTGKITPKSSLTLTIGPAGTWNALKSSEPLPLLFNDGTRAEPAPGRVELPERPEEKLNFGSKERSDSRRYQGYVPAIRDYLEEMGRTMRVVFLVLAVAGILARGVRPRSTTAGWLVALMVGFFTLVLVQFSRSSGYLATRHTLTVVALLVFWSAAAGQVVLAGMASQIAKWRSARETAALSIAGADRFVVVAFLVTAAMICLPRSLKPLHASRVAHLAAGTWLAEHSAPDAVVLDTHGWAAWKAERRAYGYTAARQAFEDPRLEYLVAERKEITAPSRRAETLRHLLEIAGEPVAEFKGLPEKPREDVLVYRWHPERFRGGVPAEEPGKTSDRSDKN